MSKVNIKRLDSVTKNDTTATEQINDNFQALQEAIENTLSRNGTTPNYMDADLDMNSYRIINSAYPEEENDIVNLKYVDERIGGAVEASKSAVNAAAQASNSAQSALVSATNAINTLRNAEEQLNSVIKYADEAIQTIDSTINDALADVKQQALDAASEAINDAAATATGIVVEYANNEIKPALNEIASNAAESAENASESAGLATNESANAAISATDSQHYAEDSRIWAEGSDSEVNNVDGEHSSKVWSEMAKTSATSAASSAELARVYGNDKINQTHITNCITEIPQDIKLELNNGVLTLKAGSKVYVPNGSGVFNAVTIANDITYGGSGISWSGKKWLVRNPNGNLFVNNGDYVSGSSYTGGTYGIWYDTTNNSVKYTSNGGSTWTSGYSLPLAQITVTSGTGVTSIDQVFNGFGYIGSTVFALPGVKGLIPNGRNEDGTLNNVEVTVNSVVIGTATTAASPHNMLLTSDNIYFDDAIYAPNWQFVYKEEENIIINTGNNVTLKGVLFGKCITDSNGVITSFSPKLPFRAVDYQEVEDIVNNLTKHVVVSVLPVEPEEDVFYYIPE